MAQTNIAPRRNFSDEVLLLLATTLEDETRVFCCCGAHMYGGLMGWSGGEITKAGSCFSHFCRFFNLLNEQRQERNWIPMSHLMKVFTL